MKIYRSLYNFASLSLIIKTRQKVELLFSCLFLKMEYTIIYDVRPVLVIILSELLTVFVHNGRYCLMFVHG